MMRKAKVIPSFGEDRKVLFAKRNGRGWAQFKSDLNVHGWKLVRTGYVYLT
jgi:hypothetical protein